MRPIGIIKPLKTSAAAIKNKLRKSIGGRYETLPVMSFPRMIYLGYAAKNSMSGLNKSSVNIALYQSKPSYRLAAYFGNYGSYGANAGIQNTNFLSDSLFRSYAYLNRLTQSLWSIYKSNNLQLSHSLLALIRTINDKNGAEPDTFFEGLPKIVRVQKKLISVLKSVDRSLFGQLRTRFGNSFVVRTGTHEVFRRTDTISRRYEKTVSAFSRLTENFYSMTPLLTRIYEGIETGVYLYSADSYRNAKTLRRLTNSLWKVYLGQNMELSRSFSRLITRVNRENKTVEQRNAEYNMFSDNRSLKSLVNALRKAFSGSNLELRNSMIGLFGDIHRAGDRKSVAVNKRFDLRSSVGIILLHREIVPERSSIRLYHRRTEQSVSPEHTSDNRRSEREIKTMLDRLEKQPSPPRTDNTEDIVRDVLEKVNRKQQLDWRLEKLQRGIF